MHKRVTRLTIVVKVLREIPNVLPHTTFLQIGSLSLHFVRSPLYYHLHKRCYEPRLAQSVETWRMFVHHGSVKICPYLAING